jgi:hypothetical protein
MTMTLDEFRATGRDVADLAAFNTLDCQGFQGPGRVYVDDLAIEGTPDRWYLTIGNDSRSDNLEALERVLYDWAIAEGYLHPDAEGTISAADISAASED